MLAVGRLACKRRHVERRCRARACVGYPVRRLLVNTSAKGTPLSVITPESDETSPYKSPQHGGLSDLERPTNIRWGVVGFGTAMSVLLYLDRFAISVATPTMMKELNIDKGQMGWAIAAFFYTYALAQVPAGWMSDKFGARRMLTWYVVAWSVAVAAIAGVPGLYSLIAMRALLGIFQAGAYPTAASLLKRWVPLDRRGVSNSSVAMGGRIGGLIANLATPQLMGLVAAFSLTSMDNSWRVVFVLYGFLGIVWAEWFRRWYRDSPSEHPGCNSAEQALIAAGRSASETVLGAKRERMPWINLVATRNMLCLCAANILVNAGWIFLVTWLPTYLTEVHGLEIKKIGWLTAVTGLAGVIGCISGGILTDIFVKKLGLVWGRRLPAVCAGSACAACYALCLTLKDPYVIIAVLAATYFLTDLSLGALWATYQDVGGSHVGSILGFNNMAGNLSAAVFSIVIGYLAEAQMWHWVFIFSAASFVLTVLSWLMVDPRIPFAPEAEKATAAG